MAVESGGNPEGTDMPVEAFSGKIRVASRVIDYLSSGIYQNPAACLKELINNSYDADATRVTISVKPEADVISIEDDGHGMTRSEFERHFSNVAESQKRSGGERTEGLKRLKIGKIGIGFIAANELCDEMEIYSTVAGSTDLLHVVINFGEIRDRPFAERREENGSVDKGDYEGDVSPEAGVDEHYTKVYLKDLRPQAIDEFTKSTDKLLGEGVSLYGLKPESVRTLLLGLKSWDQLDRYSLTRLKVGLNVPVPYLPHWYPDQYEDQLAGLTQMVSDLNFSVRYDGTELYRPIVLPNSARGSMLRSVEFEGSHISVRGYIYVQHGALQPKDMNGILLRTRQSAIGEYDRQWMGYPKQINPLFQGWATAELYVEAADPEGAGGLDEALNIDRKTLRDIHPAYVELDSWFTAIFSEVLNEAKALFYTKPTKEKRRQAVSSAAERAERLSRNVEESYGTETAREIERALGGPRQADAPPTSKQSKALLRELSALEVYEVAVECARSVLPDDLAERFLQELAKRLS